ncbi:hypothetical protein RFI_03228 [Reticulomyxa filosa]|uniref:Exonuclease 1 n=1 Tax=Reticulomyxa filosa TaxID=46433 RepID=X6P702_RETFI|nr:hypothetical protein RFI_03228 [Reticulomyxa filosa]|eukprot:ETO33868.1 hypothetical protein RFI_03228 [Reticulomyxa filosa]
MFVDTCILSGCDYLTSLPGLGFKKAHQLISKGRNVNKVVRALQLEGKIKIPCGYLNQFQKAKWTFYHQTVYDKDLKQLVHLSPLPANLLTHDISFLGPYVCFFFFLFVLFCFNLFGCISVCITKKKNKKQQQQQKQTQNVRP